MFATISADVCEKSAQVYVLEKYRVGCLMLLFGMPRNSYACQLVKEFVLTEIAMFLGYSAQIRKIFSRNEA